ncbi:hypothetical protein [Bradyrhizobium sp. STM 3562]|uniref:hypothetical protein n=1 Tax=Bradyrhizobium sp. STM 3562 TaxID=578924 RepID=UPI00388F82C2
MAVVFMLQPSRAVAGWWNRAPADFEECAELAGKAATQQERTSALADCNAKFAGRRKPGGGYTYYDFLQDRSFDIAGPNPTPEEQRYIDQQYALYLERQRRSNIVAAFAAKQQEQEQEPQPVSLRTPTERVPLPQARPSKLIANQAANNSRTRDCVKPSLSCEWPRLSETINDLKKRLFGATTPAKGKKS